MAAAENKIEHVARTLNVNLEGAAFEDETWVNFRDTARAIIEAADGLPQRKAMPRNGAGLRDLLFSEIEELQCGKGNPARATAIASLAKQIINTAQAELMFARTIKAEGGEALSSGIASFIGGSRGLVAASAEADATEASCELIKDIRESGS